MAQLKRSCNTCKHNPIVDVGQYPCNECRRDTLPKYEAKVLKEMTEEEAKEFIVQSVKSDVDIAKVADAIKAIEQQPCEDCISREQAVNELKLAYFNKDLQSAKDDPCIVDAMTDWAIRIIKRLPSVTPSNDAIREAYIKGYDYGVKDWFKAKTEPCEDCISREAVIKHLENITMDTNPDRYECKDKWYQANGFNLCKVGIEMYVENLPSVTSSYNSVKTELDHVIDEIIIRIEQTRDKDKLCEYPYNRCINIIKEEIKNAN